MDDYNNNNNQNWILQSSANRIGLPVVDDNEQRMDSWPISQPQQQYVTEIFDSTTNTVVSSSDDSWSQYSSSLNYYQNCLYGGQNFDYHQTTTTTTTMTMMTDNIDQSNNRQSQQRSSSSTIRNRDLANDQERKRMHRLNDALFRLKEV